MVLGNQTRTQHYIALSISQPGAQSSHARPPVPVTLADSNGDSNSSDHRPPAATGRIAGMEVASLILGIIGTVTGIGALAWQVVTWTRSGPVVTLIARRRGRYEAEVIARNSGRGPVSVESLGVIVNGHFWQSACSHSHLTDLRDGHRT